MGLNIEVRLLDLNQKKKRVAAAAAHGAEKGQKEMNI